MKEVIEILNFVKKSYADDSVKKQIDSSIEILKGRKGLKSQKVIDMLKALKIAYDDSSIKDKIDKAIETLEVA